MDLGAQSLTHLPASDVRDSVQRQTIEELIVVKKILSYAVHDKMQELVFLVEEERHGQVADLLLGVLVGRDEVDGLKVAEIDVPSENIDV